jgi:hypothetical protein
MPNRWVISDVRNTCEKGRMEEAAMVYFMFVRRDKGSSKNMQSVFETDISHI